MQKNLYALICLWVTVCFSSICVAGTANLTVINQNPNLKVTKYVLKYGTTEQTDPSKYPNTLQITPINGPVAEKSNNQVYLGNGVSGSFYFSVQDVYEDGSVSPFSESSFPVVVPQKPTNVRITN
ncbi:MAG: hypothetical protein WC799_13295 [Desulfobacteraceae bacterium]